MKCIQIGMLVMTFSIIVIYQNEINFANLLINRYIDNCYMSTIAKLSRFFPSLLHFQTSRVPTLQVQVATTCSTLYVHEMLQKIPKNKDKIAVIVNSQGGCLAQTNIIIQKINQIAKRNKAQVWTFGQEWALNAGFLLLTSADRVFIDRSTVVGGLEVGESKLLRGKLGKYLDTVTYSTAPSYLSEANSSESINPTKKEEIQQVYRRFSQDLAQQIIKERQNKLQQGLDLQKWYTGEEAVKAGIADQIGGVHSVFGLKQNAFVLERGQLQKWIIQIRKLNISD